MFPDLSAHLGPIYFWLFAAIAATCAINLLLVRHPLHGAISLIGIMLSLAGEYAILQSPFIAVIQVLVYAGAIMMLLVFVIMVLNQAKDHVVPAFDRSAVLGILVPVALLAVVLRELRRSGLQGAENLGAQRGGITEVAAHLFATGGPSFDAAAVGQGWWLLVEIGGLVLLAAVVGAVLLAKRSLDTPVDDEPARLDAHEVEPEHAAAAEAATAAHAAPTGAH